MSAEVKERTTSATEVDIEEIQTTRSEKLLAFVLAAFLLVGGIWVYFKLDDVPAKPHYYSLPGQFSSKDDTTIARHRRANRSLLRARGQERRARADLELRREEYRTALDAGAPSAALQRSYEQARASYAGARLAKGEAARLARATKPAADAATRREDASAQQAADRYDAKRRAHDRNTFLLRLLYVLGTAGAAFWLLTRVRTRRPRFLPLALAFIGFATVQALVMAADYTYDYVEFGEVGPATISLLGILMTFAAFIALQRYLARRIPQRRVRKRECPFCGYPVTGNDRCEGCGRAVFADCATCTNRRRVGTAYCGVCGST